MCEEEEEEEEEAIREEASSWGGSGKTRGETDGGNEEWWRGGRWSRETIKDGGRSMGGEEGRKEQGGGRVAIWTSNSVEGNLMFLLQLHLHVYKQEWQLLY